MSARFDSLITFEIPGESFGAVLGLSKKAGGPASVGEAIRQILDQTDWRKVQPIKPANRQVSVRVSADTKAKLTALAKSKGMSLGNLLRAAIGAQSETPSPGMANTKHKNIMAKKVAKKVAKKAAKKVAKKAPAKKVVKKAVKKAPAKKAAKKVAKKAAKKVAKKVAKKAPAKKAAKKAAKKKK